MRSCQVQTTLSIKKKKIADLVDLEERRSNKSAYREGSWRAELDPRIQNNFLRHSWQKANSRLFSTAKILNASDKMVLSQSAQTGLSWLTDRHFCRYGFNLGSLLFMVVSSYKMLNISAFVTIPKLFLFVSLEGFIPEKIRAIGFFSTHGTGPIIPDDPLYFCDVSTP